MGWNHQQEAVFSAVVIRLLDYLFWVGIKQGKSMAIWRDLPLDSVSW